MVTIPEDGDLVMLGFEYGDPSRPYVTGSLFSEKTGAGGGDGNKTKSITTRSGSTVTLDDDKGNVMIKDKHGADSTITLDGEKNIVVNADLSILLTSGQSSILLKKDGSIDITGVNITINGSTNSTMQSGSVSFSATSQGAEGKMEGGKLDIDATNITSVSGTSEVNIESAKITVDGTANVDITGGLVKINS
jgi:uncharacterized protein involved in type VI secretion and phage assembly